MLKKDRIIRKRRIRAKVKGTTQRPRVSVFKSNKFIYAQAIDDQKGLTLASSSDQGSRFALGSKTARAEAVGQDLATNLAKKKIKKIVFDRSGYPYHGRIKALAQKLREEGVEF